MAKNVFISSTLPREAVGLIPRDFTLDYNNSEVPLSKAELVSRLNGKDGLICHIISTIDEEVLASAPTLRVVANVAVGYNNIDVAAARRRGVIVTNTPDVLTETTADFAWTLLREADFVTLHTNLTPETRHLIGERTLRMMRKSAIVVNAARGPIVDEAALARALREGWIAGAGLDVFEEEPRIHPDLLPLQNVVLAPHIASASRDTRVAMATLAVRNCVAVLEGKAPITPVA